MAAEYKITLVDSGGSGSGGGGAAGPPSPGGGNSGSGAPSYAQPPWALNPATNQSLANIPNARPAGLFGGGMKSAIAMAGMAGQGGVAGAFGRIGNAYNLPGAAGGMNGVAFQAADEAGKLIAGAINAVGNGARAIGGMLQDLAGNNFMGMFQKSIGLATGALEKIPIVGQVWAAYLRTAGAVVEAFTGVVQAFVARGEILQRYSGAVAGARSQAEVRTIMSDIREARLLGGDTASLTDSSSRIENTLREIMEPIKAFVLQNLAEFLEVVADILQGLAPYIKSSFEFIMGSLEFIIDLMTGRFWKLSEDAQRTRERTLKALTKDQDDASELLDDFFLGFGVGVPSDPTRTEMQQKVNTPNFAGI